MNDSVGLRDCFDVVRHRRCSYSVLSFSSFLLVQRKAKLLFRASRDGWFAGDFFSKCSNKGPTLVLVKSAGCGFIFGSFTAVPWFRPPQPTPEVLASGGSRLFSNVFDRSYRSFLFSLHNASKFPFRMTLTSTLGPAMIVHPTLGPMFGGKTKGPDGVNTQWPNLSLCWNDRPGHATHSNISNDPISSSCAYQLEID
jgi:hypothetical protein